MKPKSYADTILEVELKVRIRQKVYKLSLSSVLKWLLPVALMVAKVITLFRRDGP